MYLPFTFLLLTPTPTVLCALPHRTWTQFGSAVVNSVI